MIIRTLSLGLLIALVAVSITGCGMIADKELIVIAKIGEENFTRGDLRKLIYDMDDQERPRIATRSDLVRVVQDELDKRIKIPLGKELAEQGKVQVNRNAARELFFSTAGDNQTMYRSVFAMDLENMSGVTDLMQIYNLTEAHLRSQKDLIELETDIVIERLQGEQAVMVLGGEALQSGEITLPQDLLRAEYELRKEEFQRFEWMKFAALRFPVSDEASGSEAAGIVERIQKGESFNAILQEYAQNSPKNVFESEIENNPGLSRFRSFWEQASGAEIGQILGPIHMPEYSQVAIDAQGNQRTVTQEAAFLVLKVLERRDPEPMSIEEATPKLAPGLIYSEMMEKLRKDHGVEIFEDKIPDPSIHGGGGVPYALPQQQQQG